MIATRSQSEAHSPVALDALKRFLKLKKWNHRLNSAKTMLIYEGASDDEGQPIILTLPVGTEFNDTHELVCKVLRALAAIYRTTFKNICEEVNNIGCDFIRQRIVTSSNSVTLSLKTANEVISALSDIVDYSACLEEDPQPYYERKRKIGRRFVEKCRFGQTFEGSFGLSILMPIAPSLLDDATQAPIERRIMIRIARGLYSIFQGIQEADAAVFLQSYKQGFNANLLESILHMNRFLGNHSFEFSFSWSPEYRVPDDLQNVNCLLFDPEVVTPLVETAAKSLRSTSESKEIAITGKIVQLRITDEGLNDDESIEGGDIDPARRVIVVDWEHAPGRFVNIRVPLSINDYKLACDAHRDGKSVVISGRPEKSGKSYYLASSSNFQVK